MVLTDNTHGITYPIDRVSTTFTTTVIVILFAILHSGSTASYNDVCGPSIHCDVSAGLICTANRCACSQGPLNGEYSYSLEWDAGRNQCVGKHGSACVGTRQTPIQNGMKSVPCVEMLSCIQIPDMPQGIGSCQNVPKVHLHGVACNNLQYCDASRNLVCTNGACACSNSRPNTSPQYELIWDDVDNDCVAPVGAPCLGTKTNPVANGQKMIRCIANSECLDAPDATPAVGICQSSDSSTTTVSPNPSSTEQNSSAPRNWFNNEFKILSSFLLSLIVFLQITV